MLPRVLDCRRRDLKYPLRARDSGSGVCRRLRCGAWVNERGRRRAVLAFSPDADFGGPSDAALLKRSSGAGIAVIISTADPDLTAYLAARELWQTRRRAWDDDQAGMKHGLERLQQMIDLVGQDMACHLVFEEERRYWQKRNRAADRGRSGGRIR